MSLMKRLSWRGLGCLVATAVLFGLQVSAGTPEENWPAWRGPLSTGASLTAQPPVAWSETNNVKWKIRIPGYGTATPVIWDDRIFIQTAIPTEAKPNESPDRPAVPPPSGRGGGRPNTEKPTEPYQFVVICLERQSGKILWQKKAQETVPHEGFYVGEGSLASASPVTDGKQVYAFFGSRGLYCFDLQGNQKWSRDLGKMRVKMSFGEGSSPALLGNTLVITWDHEDGSFIVAIDKDTGQELWRQARAEATSWATPLIVQYGGKAQVVTDASSKIRSYDLSTGALLWECAGLTANVIPTPVADDQFVYCMSGFRGNSLMAIRLGGSGDLTDSDSIVWKHNKSTPYVPSPLLIGGTLYFFGGNDAIFSGLDAKTGTKLIDAERFTELKGVYASPVGAAGRLYLVGRNGVCIVARALGKLEVLATNRLEEHFDASPALAGKQLFLRGRDYLYCLEEK